jgi:hypothetical protein
VSASRLVIEGRATVAGEEYESGYVAIEGCLISAAGTGRAPDEQAGASRRLADRAEEVAL